MRKKLEGNDYAADNLEDDKNAYAGRNGRPLPMGTKPRKPKKEDLIIIDSED